MKRGKPEPLIAEVAFCVRLGWTLDELYSSPTRFIELIQIYLNTESDIAQRDKEDIKRILEKIRYDSL